jgi:hypothetical protein
MASRSPPQQQAGIRQLGQSLCTGALAGFGVELIEHRRRLAAAATGRQLTGQLPEQQQAKRVEIGGGADRLPAQLFRFHIGRRQTAAGGFGLAFVEQLGDAEVEQFGFAARIHHHVGGLQVTVHHQLAMGMIDCAKDLLEKTQSIVQTQRILFAPVGDCSAIDTLQRQPA